MQTTYCAGRKLQIRHSIERASDVDYSTFDGRTSDVEYSPSDGRPIECRKSDIRRRALRMSNIRHSTEANIGSKIGSNLFAHFYCRCVYHSHSNWNSHSKGALCANRINVDLVLFYTFLRQLPKCIWNKMFIVNKPKIIATSIF